MFISCPASSPIVSALSWLQGTLLGNVATAVAGAVGGARRGVDAVLDCADLGCDFKGGVFNLLFAHDCSFPGARTGAGCLSDWEAADLAVEESCETFEPGEVHSRRKRCSGRDQDDPEQPLADTHLIPGVAPRCERHLQGGSE